MAPSFWQIAIVAVLVVLLFGRGKISGLMGDVAKGIKSFKKGMADDPQEVAKKDDEGKGAIDVTPAEKKDA
ncbi:twin-arginine translocase TatA/TatE family subunit [Rhodovulum sp. DZ06]|uniref:twin-arginine translocase TatA/TatE family subunit n=1 Tax=Rhodovulum sp. DZ06 TaxID=3425126 RepID=UPI003D344D39